ncbi:MAG: vitamin B12-dependent ribonucleotide reductase [Firmicutes bacterium]|nr:vitamin B12-dependent ribonucleotide reductase [Bacillota bacterium]
MGVKLSQNALNVLEKRYLKKVDGKVVETPDELFERVAENIASVEGACYGKDPATVEAIKQQFLEIMTNLEFMPNSPTLMNAGRELQQLAACFVLPVEDSMESIFDSIKHAALIHKSGGGTGFSFSKLRPCNDQVLSTGGVASGPISFMKVFNAATDAVKQGGTRRGANMGILRVDHPDILAFINAKENNDDLTNFNISVAITDKFMTALKEHRDYELINPRNGQVVGKLSAQEVFDKIVDAAWRNGEPGVIFIDQINRDNPTPHIGEIESTNPCGEQPLLPYEACNLGSVNLGKMVTEDGQINWQRLEYVVKVAVRFLDDVIDASKYPLERITEMVRANRKIGLGVMGFADMLIKLGIPYNSEKAVETAEAVMSFIQRTARAASAELAEERGVFPNYKGSIYEPMGLKLRNATTTTIAPTGTISIIAEASGGIEPLFAIAFVRNVLDNTKLVEVNPLFEEIAKREGFYTPQLMEQVAEHGSVQEIESIPEKFRRLFVTAHDIEPEWHIRIQAAFQKYTDNAVSKTINFPKSATREDVAKAYLLAYQEGCKGVTVYRDGSRESQVLTAGTKTAQQTTTTEAAPLYPMNITPRPRPDVTTGATERVKVGCGTLYVSVNADEFGICEVFTNTGKEGGCSSQSEATSRLISIALRSGVSVEAIYEQLRGIRCPACVRRKEVNVTSCPDAIARAIKKFQDQVLGGFQPHLPFKPEGAQAVQQEAAIAEDSAHCPECGHKLSHESGCVTCIACGYTKCG